MIRSMTAFIREETQEKNWTTTWEIRSTNQRYLEIHIYLPDIIRELETNIRKKIIDSNAIKRGRIECKLHINTHYNTIQNPPITLNTKLIKELIESIQKIPGQNIYNIDPMKILSWPGVIIQNTNNIYNIYPNLLKSFNNALHKFITVREQEGADLKNIIKKRLLKIYFEIDNIKKTVPLILPSYKQKLLKKIKEINIINIDIDNNKLKEELIIYAQRSDISEEIDRLEIHIKNIHLILSQEKIVGRKLEFITQELYREINTISSKSMNISITQSSIEIKVLIDQIREQIQNIE